MDQIVELVWRFDLVEDYIVIEVFVKVNGIVDYLVFFFIELNNDVLFWFIDLGEFIVEFLEFFSVFLDVCIWNYWDGINFIGVNFCL